MTNEEELEIMEDLDAMYEAEKKEHDKFLKMKQVFKENGLYKGNFDNFECELFDGFLWEQNIGYVDVEEYKDKYKPNKKCFKVSENSIKEFPDLKGLVFTEETIDNFEDYEIHDTYLVCQWCNYEDDYTGYILFPMKNGKYWCIYYNM